jgi:hypothetical protein
MPPDEAFCLFIGYHRSGHSIIGALLDAHPDVIIPHEYNALAHIRNGCTRRQLFMGLAAASFKQAHEGRREGRYSYAVPGQWQGKYRSMKVIGDKKGSGTTQLLMQDYSLLQKLRDVVGRELRIIHVTRNPFDNMASQLRYAPHPLSQEQIRRTIEQYFAQADMNERVMREHGDKTLGFRQEDFIAGPADILRRLCTHLGVDPYDDYIDDCAAIVYASPHKSRTEVEWTPELITEITERIASYNFLEAYSFEE